MGDLKKAKTVAKEMIPLLKAVEDLMDKTGIGNMSVSINRESDYFRLTAQDMEEEIMKINGVTKIRIPERYEELKDEDCN